MSVLEGYDRFMKYNLHRLTEPSPEPASAPEVRAAAEDAAADECDQQLKLNEGE